MQSVHAAQAGPHSCTQAAWRSRCHSKAGMCAHLQHRGVVVRCGEQLGLLLLRCRRCCRRRRCRGCLLLLLLRGGLLLVKLATLPAVPAARLARRRCRLGLLRRRLWRRLGRCRHRGAQVVAAGPQPVQRAQLQRRCGEEAHAEARRGDPRRQLQRQHRAARVVCQALPAQAAQLWVLAQRGRQMGQVERALGVVPAQGAGGGDAGTRWAGARALKGRARCRAAAMPKLLPKDCAP